MGSSRHGTPNLRRDLVLSLGPIHFHKKHLPEITFYQKMLGRNFVIPNVHFPKRAFAEITLT